ncbi:hypothetical protein BC828DRAFT_407545 [Blastocladiella britannica]|nr:hypothetical protein BC828DRAFT_407545 [Blastocladiella britannica]
MADDDAAPSLTLPPPTTTTSASALHAIVLWIASFPNLSHPCAGPADILDGVLLLDIAIQIDAAWFSGPEAPPTTVTPLSPIVPAASSASAWIPRYNALKRLHRLTLSYLTDVLGITLPTTVAAVAVDKIARAGDLDQLARLASLLLLLAVHARAAPAIVSRIQLLDTPTQAQLMLLIESLLTASSSSVLPSSAAAANGASTSSTDTSRASTPVPPVAAATTLDGDSYAAAEHVAQLEADRRTAEDHLAQMRAQYDTLAAEFRDVVADRNSLRLALESASGKSVAITAPPLPRGAGPNQPTTKAAASAAANDADNDNDVDRPRPPSSRDDHVTPTSTDVALLKAELVRTRAALAASENQRHEIGSLVRDQERMLADQARRLADHGQLAATVRALRDEADELRDAAARATALQGQLDRARAKLADVPETKRALKAAADDADRLRGQVARLEREVVSMAAAVGPQGSTGNGNDGPPPNAATAADDAGAQLAREYHAKWIASQEQLAAVAADADLARTRAAEIEALLAREQGRVVELSDALQELEADASAARAAALASHESLAGSIRAADADGAAAAATAAATVAATEIAALRLSAESAMCDRDALRVQLDSHKQLLDKARSLIIQANAERDASAKRHALELEQARRSSSSAAPAPVPAAPTISHHHRDDTAAAAFAEVRAALQAQIDAYAKEVEALWDENRRVRDAAKREQALMASAWHATVATKMARSPLTGATAAAGRPC